MNLVISWPAKVHSKSFRHFFYKRRGKIV